jgi:hypothetical protein
MRIVEKDTEISTHFIVLDPTDDSPVTGLVTVDFDIYLVENSTDVDPPGVVISEVGNGIYLATFTPTELGIYYLRILHTTYNMRGWQ